MLDLEDEDLVALGVELVGHRKKLLKNISALRNGKNVTTSSSSVTNDSSVSNSDNGSVLSDDSDEQITKVKKTVTLKLYYNQDITRINVKKDISLEKFKEDEDPIEKPLFLVFYLGRDLFTNKELVAAYGENVKKIICKK